MSWSGFFADYGLDASDPGVSSYVRGAIIQDLVGEGASANSIIGVLQGEGISVRRQTALQMIKAEQERQQAGGTSAQLGIDYSTGELLPGEPPANWTGQYVHQVTATYRTMGENGAYELHIATKGIKSSIALTPLQATNAAMDIFETPPEEGVPRSPNVIAGQDVLSYQLTGVWYDTQGRNLPNTRFEGLSEGM
jgi:hypothetical protein